MVSVRAFRAVVLVFAVSASSLAGAASPYRFVPFPGDINQTFSSQGIPSQDWSAAALPLTPYDKNRPFAYASNESEMSNPASVAKVFTTGLALEKLGSRYRFKTDFLAMAEPVDGVLQGDLFVKGSGDPVFLTPDLWASLNRLRARGVRTISGNVVLDREAFATAKMSALVGGDDDFDDAMHRAYHAEPDALLLNHGAMYLEIDVDGDKARVRSEDAPKNWAFVSELTPKSGRCTSWKNGLDVTFNKVLDNVVVTVRGNYPLRCGSGGIPIRVPNQTWLWESWFKQLWSEMGGKFSGQVVEGSAPAEVIVLYSHLGPELNRIIQDVNKWSSNVMARHLELALTGLDGDFNKIVTGWLSSLGLPVKGWYLENGSGLARETRVTAKGTAEFLLYMANRPDFPDYLASFPRAGADGTVYRRFKGIDHFGYFKTGSLSGVRSIAGYVRAKSGQQYALAIFVNGAKAYNAWPGFEKLVGFLYENG